jgi:hypothetical protein
MGEAGTLTQRETAVGVGCGVVEVDNLGEDDGRARGVIPPVPTSSCPAQAREYSVICMSCETNHIRTVARTDTAIHKAQRTTTCVKKGLSAGQCQLQGSALFLQPAYRSDQEYSHINEMGTPAYEGVETREGVLSAIVLELIVDVRGECQHNNQKQKQQPEPPVERGILFAADPVGYLIVNLCATQQPVPHQHNTDDSSSNSSGATTDCANRVVTTHPEA